MLDGPVDRNRARCPHGAVDQTGLAKVRLPVLDICRPDVRDHSVAEAFEERLHAPLEVSSGLELPRSHVALLEYLDEVSERKRTVLRDGDATSAWIERPGTNCRFDLVEDR